ncbi:MAG: ASPIC/UnbV domain-containing protein, partial [Verrucomicrobia bacterium]|nr:ASPIC/UnbV domain-containing protein [Verrucomicrobiota bacterium]
GLGSKIKVLGGPVPQTQEIMAGGRFLSSDDSMRTFACGAATNLTIEVAWRGGLRSLFTNARPNHIYEIDEKPAPPSPREERAGRGPGRGGLLSRT